MPCHQQKGSSCDSRTEREGGGIRTPRMAIRTKHKNSSPLAQAQPARRSPSTFPDTLIAPSGCRKHIFLLRLNIRKPLGSQLSNIFRKSLHSKEFIFLSSPTNEFTPKRILCQNIFLTFCSKMKVTVHFRSSLLLFLQEVCGNSRWSLL